MATDLSRYRSDTFLIQTTLSKGSIYSYIVLGIILHNCVLLLDIQVLLYFFNIYI